MNITTAFPSKYVKAADLNGQDVPVVMANVVMEDVEEGEKLPVLYFSGMKKGMVLNKTNASTIAALYSEETNNWLGKAITIHPDKTEFGGKRVDCIRVRGVAPTGTAPVTPPPPPTTPAGVSF